MATSRASHGYAIAHASNNCPDGVICRLQVAGAGCGLQVIFVLCTYVLVNVRTGQVQAMNVFQTKCYINRQIFY